MTNPDLPPEVELFLERIASLPEAVWQELLDRSKPRFRDWLFELWIGITSPFRRRQFADIDLRYSEAAWRRVDDLLRDRAIPKDLSWRIKWMLHVAVQALCSRASLTPRQFAGAYAPFEPYVPSASLPSPSSEGRRQGGA